MGDDGRKSYEHKAGKGKSKKVEPSTPESKVSESKGGSYVVKAMALLAFLIIILGACACFLSKSLTGEFPEHRLSVRADRIPANR